MKCYVTSDSLFQGSKGQKSENIPPDSGASARGEKICIQQRSVRGDGQSEARGAEVDQWEAEETDNSLSSDVELIIRRWLGNILF